MLGDEDRLYVGTWGGGLEAGTPVFVEPLLKYDPSFVWVLTRETRTLIGGEIDWGGRIQKCNGGF